MIPIFVTITTYIHRLLPWNRITAVFWPLVLSGNVLQCVLTLPYWEASVAKETAAPACPSCPRAVVISIDDLALWISLGLGHVWRGRGTVRILKRIWIPNDWRL